MRTVKWHNDAVRMIDQRLLPARVEMLDLHDYKDVAHAITDMAVRGAPAIGATAGFGLALAGYQSKADNLADLRKDLDEAQALLRESRPTAVNLGWALNRLMKIAAQEWDTANELREALLREAEMIADDDVRINRRMASYGATLIHNGDTVLHHCNTGALATVDYGTALGVIRMAHEQGKHFHVLVDETRPRLQGARLTAWELKQLDVPFDLIADNAAGHFMRIGEVQAVFVGADRVAANGDVANKIGTYKLAVVARENGIPFYAVVPTSTVDLSLETGDDIPIEERDAAEVLELTFKGSPAAPDGISVRNPAFDITPHRYVTAIVTEKGLVYPPFKQNLRKAVLSDNV